MKNKVILIGLVIFSSTVFFFTACKKESISEQDRAALKKEIKSSTLDPDVIAFQEAHQKYRMALAETFKANNITTEKLHTALSTGETSEIDKIIFESDIIEKIKAMQPHLEKLEIDKEGCSTCPSKKDIEEYTFEEKEAIFNNMLMTDKSIASRGDCIQPQYASCLAGCALILAGCLHAGGSLQCIINNFFCVQTCHDLYCSSGGGSDPDCPGCPVEHGDGG